MRERAIIIVFLSFFANAGFAQFSAIFERCIPDTNYIETYRDDLILRIYTSNKINFFKLEDTEGELSIKYRPNDFYNLGIGVNYKWFGINIGTPFPLSTRDEQKYGKTNTFGIQSYIYRRKFTIDVLAKKTKGYFISDSDEVLPQFDDLEIEYSRRDIQTQNFGLNVNYIFNNRRFSHRAAFKQTERQIQSAGSLLAGFGLYSFLASADSAIVPREIDDRYFAKNRDFRGSLSFSANMNVGYAYSYVFAKNWLLTGSFISSVGLEHLRFRYFDQNTQKKLRPNFNWQLRLALSYQCKNYMAGLSFVRFSHGSSLEVPEMSITNGSDFVRFTISRRLQLSKK